MGRRAKSGILAIILGELIVCVILVYSLIAWQVTGSYGDRSGESVESSVTDQDVTAENGMAAPPSVDVTQSSSSAVARVMTGAPGAISADAGGPVAPGYSTFPYSRPSPYSYSYPYGSYAYWYASGPYSFQNARAIYAPSFRYPATYAYPNPFAFNAPYSGSRPVIAPIGGNNPWMTVPGYTYPSAPGPTALTNSAPSVPAKSTLVPSVQVPSPAQPPAPTPPKSASPSNTVWLPDRSQWPPSTSFQAAAVSPGKQYWHLVRALYCDFNDTRNNCPNLPGGGAGTSTYVMLIDSSGRRMDAPLLSPPGQQQKSPSDMCNCNYTFLDGSTAIQIGGNPSDSIAGLVLYSVQAGLSQYHVRYFLTFQLSTK
jgi:hypothetical protein